MEILPSSWLHQYEQDHYIYDFMYNSKGGETKHLSNFYFHI